MPTTFDVKSFDAVRDLERYFNSKEWRRIVRPCFAKNCLFLPLWGGAEFTGGLKECGFVDVVDASTPSGKKKVRSITIRQAVLNSGNSAIWKMPKGAGITGAVRDGVLTVLPDDVKRKVLMSRNQSPDAGFRQFKQVPAQAPA